MVQKHYKDKEALVAELHEKLTSASTVVITEYRGLKAVDMVKLRQASARLERRSARGEKQPCCAAPPKAR